MRRIREEKIRETKRNEDLKRVEEEEEAGDGGEEEEDEAEEEGRRARGRTRSRVGGEG